MLSYTKQKEDETSKQKKCVRTKLLDSAFTKQERPNSDSSSK